MSENYTQSRRPLMVSTPLGTNKLLLIGLEGEEEISKLFTFRLNLLATNGMPVQFERLLGQPMLVSVRILDESKEGGAAKHRYFSGICSRFSQGNRDHDFTEYRAEMVPHLWLLTRRSQSRIFQQMSVPDILKKVLKGIKVTFEIDGHFEKREYCVQYRETDFAFVSRLMEEEGIFYFFRHTKDAHEMIVGNSPRVHLEVPGPHTARWNNVDGTDREGNHIHQWQKHQEVRSGKITLWDHSFELPHDNLEATKSTLGTVKVGKITQKLAVADNEQLEIYEYPGDYAKRFDGTSRDGDPTPAEIKKIFEDNQRTAQIRMQAETVAGITIRGTSNCRHFTTGHHFILGEHFNAEGKYVLTSVNHSAKLGNAYRSGGTESFDYKNTFSCIPHELPFRPQRTVPKPLITGVQTATVAGPQGQEIFVDKHARVKVQFPWDREGQYDAHSSCWIRVSQAWGGGSFGGMSIPRIGHEVIVGFVEGDPDRPIITGRVYNAKNMPHPSNAGRKTPGPPSMKEAAMMTSFKSQSTPGGNGFNEITMNDTKGAEGLHFKAQKDEIHNVGNDREDTVGNNETRKVAVDRSREVGNNETVKIGNNEIVTIGSNATETVGIAKVIDVGATLLIKAGVSITLQCGASTIHMNAAGIITISGLMVTMAGSAMATVAAPIATVAGVLVTSSGVVNLVSGAALANVAGGVTRVVAATSNVVKGSKVFINT